MNCKVTHGEKMTNQLSRRWEGMPERSKELSARSGFWRKFSSPEPRMP